MTADWKLVVVNFSGIIYTILIISGIAFLNLYYTCPALNGQNNCSWPFIYSCVIIIQITLNLTLFHYFNRRNQISYWRVKSSSFLSSSQTPISNSCNTFQRNFTALNIYDSQDLTNHQNYENRVNSDFIKNNKQSLLLDDNESENKRSLRNQIVKKNVPSILETNNVVQQQADNDSNQYKHNFESNQLVATYEGVYHNVSNFINPESTDENLLKSSPKTRTKWCNKCSQMTPRRCHHCPLCNICVLRKDHHCFITGGCVGLANQRYFIVFLLWAFLGSFYGAIFNFSYLNKFVEPWFPLGWFYYIGPVALIRWFLGSCTFFNMCLSVMLSLSIASSFAALAFLCAQMFYTLNGYTMHDYHVGRLQDHLESDGENFNERLALVFGRRWWVNFFIPQVWFNNEMTPAIAHNIFVSISKDL